MQLKWENLAAGAAGIVVLMLVWFAGPIFHVAGANALVLRGGVLLLGVIAILGLLLWARSKRPAAEPAQESAAPRPVASGGGACEDVDILIREAAAKVAAARLAAGAKLPSLPTVFLLGETGAGKTSVMDQCGLDAELLAGQVYHESSIVPTRTTNLWFARKTVFVEAGGPLVDDGASWVRLIKHFLPGRFRAIFSRAKMAPRAAVVCLDSEKLLHEASLDRVVSQARKLRARLEELSYHMGVSLPVYVLFNRSDRISYFDEFCTNFSNEETSQILGTTLALVPPTGSGVYAEQETRRLTSAFQGLFFSLAECRPGLLSRERNSERQSAVYEFPREFGKLSKPLVQFLVDLCRPGHLRAGPFLRGFYFVGQRTVAVAAAGGQTMLGAAAAAGRSQGGFSADATSLLSAHDPAAKMAWASGTTLESPGETRKTRQRVFLNHIFSHIILQDRAALGASGASTRGDLGRRILLATVAALAIVWVIALLVSFVGNASLVNTVRQASQNLSVVESPGLQVPTVESLRRLDTLRQSLVRLRDYDQSGAPLHLRWGLFTGDRVLDDARAIYFRSFDQILFQHTKQNLLTDLRGYRGDPQASADSGSAYDALKAYLLTTSESQRNSGEFLQNFLMKEWRKNWGDLEQDRNDLAAQQFAFYSSELTIDNPHSKTNEIVLVDQVRAYLNRLAGPQRIYLSMLADARQKAKDYRYAAAHPDAADVVKVGHDVSGAFTSDGWKLMDANIRDAKRFLQGEPWVLGTGTATSTNLSPADLEAQLRAMYEKDYIQEWRAVLNNSSVLPTAGFGDTAQKLKKLSVNSSPILALLCDVSDNTNVESNAVKVAFQAPQQVVVPGCGAQKKYNQPANDPYMKGLLNLQVCTQLIADAPPDQRDAAKTSCGQTATQALLTADTIAQAFTNDPDGHVDTTTRVLMEEPIKSIQRKIIEGAASATALCAPYKTLQGAYPFNAHGVREASLQEINGFFQPGTGALSKFLAEQKSAIALQGPALVKAPGRSAPVGNGFLRFVNEMYAIQQAVYPNNSPDPKFEYTVAARLPEAGGFKNEKLIFDGQEMSIAGGKETSKKFTWPGSAQKATLSLNNGGGDLDLQTAQGLWAVARFFGGYRWQPSGNGYSIQGPLLGPTGQPMTSGGRPVEVRFQVEFKGVPLFEAGFLSSYACPANMKQ
jgi:type VI secretion system protein ImpL